MKGFLFHIDKSTRKDEMLLFLFILMCLCVGVLLYAFAPANWIIPESTIKTFGVIWIPAGVVFIPRLIDRLVNNR